jgi:Xaa-Pro aminopeptidase
MNYAERRSRVHADLAAEGLDGLLVTRLTNIRYLTGFSGTTAFLVFATEPVLAVDFRYAEQAAGEVSDVEVQTVQSSRELWPAVKRLLGEGRWSRIGLEAEQLTLQQYLELTGSDGTVEWQPTSGLVERRRRVKEPEELAAIREAIRITDEAMSDLIELLEPGTTEQRVAGEIERLQRAKGGERSASEIAVASGPRTALPHGMPSGRVLGVNEPVMFDLGTVVRGYLADLTRTIYLGPAPDEFRRIYEIVLAAQRAAEAAVRPGLTGREVDAVARDLIGEAGYGDRFGHSLGHSIGLDNHEQPLLSPHDETPLEPGMVYTVEPGIYVPGFAGVRIEDVVVVTDDGCEVLTESSKELIEL